MLENNLLRHVESIGFGLFGLIKVYTVMCDQNKTTIHLILHIVNAFFFTPYTYD
jgi:hypothetical protein